MIPLKSITIKLAEGPYEVCERFKHVIRATWEAADEAARAIVDALKAHRGLGYYKSDVAVEFADGFAYRMRYDIDPDKFELLSTAVRDDIRFYAGLYQPAHMNVDDYFTILEEDGRRGELRRAFETHDFPRRV